MVEEEMRRYRPTKNYLEHLPPLNLHQFETDILRAEFERLSSRQPPEHMSMKRYELPAPPTGRLTDVQSWRDSVDNSRAQLEHQSVRIENLQLLLAHRIRCLALSQRHSGGAWLLRLKRRLQATRKAVKEVNLQRKTEQSGKIADLETAVSKAEAERPLPQTEKSTEPRKLHRWKLRKLAEASDDNDETAADARQRWPSSTPAWEASLTQLSSQQQQQHRRCEELRVLLAFVKAWDPRVFNWRVQAASQLITGLAEEGFTSLAGRFWPVWPSEARALLGGALLPRVGNFGLAFGAACAAVAYAVANRGGFVSLADAIRSMPPEKRTRLAELTADAMRDMNAMDSATWASLIATDAQFRARLLQLARRFAYGQQTADEEADEAREAELPIGTPAAASMTSVEQQHQRAGGVRCYYELLEVERQATDDELKKAYRRLALRWHPDKNPDRVEEATAHFRLVQKAYETLSDPQERAWYDKHRERILKGGLGRGDAYQEERLDVFQFFTSACYDDYDDGEEGYFTVYARVFSDLAEEERRACDGDDEPPPDFPGWRLLMANQSLAAPTPHTTHGGQAVHARALGTSYAQSYVWVEKYDTREAPNKYARKAMEKENRAARDAARRERNEEIRTLVAFVKKRDPRARAREVEAKAKAMASAARKAHLETASRYRAPDWARTDDLEAELAKIEAEHGAGAPI
uniref:DnaJ homolog subfamily C member 21 n=1 Tax=Macrostomum lignano TaxID=282301 RepID=A0A1I8JR25_9PLAT